MIKHKSFLLMLVVLLTTLLASVSSADPVRYSMRMESSGLIAPSSTQPPVDNSQSNVWVAAAPVYGAWTDVAPIEEANCGAWSPLEADVNNGTQYLKERSCSTEQSRTVTTREYNASTSQYRTVAESAEQRTINSPQYQQAVGTKLILNCSFDSMNSEVNRSRGGIGMHNWIYNGVILGNSTGSELTVGGITYYQGAEQAMMRYEICTEAP